MQKEKFELWCILELFGHQKIAGLVTEQAIGGASFIRVDVPAVGEIPAYTRMLHANAVYAINPVDEETCRAMAERLQTKPIDSYDMREIVRRSVENQLKALPQTSGADDEVDDDDLF